MYSRKKDDGHPPLVVGICGESGAGKSTSTEILRSHGFVPFSVSALVREEAESFYGPDPSRETVQKHARETQAAKGADYFALKFLREYDPFQHNRVALDGIRNRKERDTLRMAANECDGVFVMLGLETSHQARFHRVRQRGRGGDPESIEEFKAADARAANHAGFQENHFLVEQADFRIVNDGTVKDLENKIIEIVRKMMVSTSGQ